MAKAPKGGLGRGFGALLSDSLFEDEAQDGVSTLPMTLIEPNREQPRRQFDPELMRELTDSIAMHGVISPITVRKMESGYYQIIAGERRWRAARSAGLTEIPALVLEVDDSEVMQLALIENLQRTDLSPIEEAEGYNNLMQKHGLTQDQVAERVGKSRSTVANALRLLQLPEEALEMVSAGTLSAGHARAVLAIKDQELQAASLDKISKMSVRQAERYAKSCNVPTVQKSVPASDFQPDYMAEIESKLETVLGRKVTVTQGKNSGSVALEYYGADDLERLLAALEKLSV